MNISDELREKLKDCRSDVEVAKILADNGVDVEEFQKSLPDEVLEKIGGGFKDIFGHKIVCAWCGEELSDNISYQVVASFLNNVDFYRCRKCAKFFAEASVNGTSTTIRVADPMAD